MVSKAGGLHPQPSKSQGTHSSLEVPRDHKYLDHPTLGLATALRVRRGGG